MEPRKVVEIARKRGLRGLAITDHDTVAGAMDAMQYQDENFLIIPGFEKTTTAGDILGLFMTEAPDPQLKDPLAVVEFIHQRGGLAIMPHPFAYRVTIGKELVKCLDGIEGYNARYPTTQVPGITFGTNEIVEFARANNLEVTCSSDSHDYGAIARARTVIPAEILEEIRDAIKRGNMVMAPPPPTAIDRLASKIGEATRRLLGPSEPPPTLWEGGPRLGDDEEPGADKE